MILVLLDDLLIGKPSFPTDARSGISDRRENADTHNERGYGHSCQWIPALTKTIPGRSDAPLAVPGIKVRFLLPAAIMPERRFSSIWI